MLDTFGRLLPVPLNETERRAFGRMHLRQLYFGGLPAVLLAERFPLLSPILTKVYEEPDNTTAVGVMHTLLGFYAQMAETRRRLDRNVHARKAGAHRAGQANVDVSLGDV